MIAQVLTGAQAAQACLTTIIGICLAIVGWVLNKKTKEIHVLVNAQMTAALSRIADLEQKLDLRPGEPIPSPAIVTPVTAEPLPASTAGQPTPVAPTEPLPDQPQEAKP